MRFLFSTTPLDGHFRPMLPLARALRDRGHQVAVATEAGWHDQVEAEGFDALAAGPAHDLAWRHAATTLGDGVASALENRGDDVFALVFGEGHANLKARELAEVAHQWRAGAIVFESADLAGPPVATALGLPSVHHSWGPKPPTAWYEAASTRVRDAWNVFGLEPATFAGMFDGLYIDLAPASFHSEPPPAHRFAMRPVLARTSPAPSWLNALDPPLVYVTLGTLFNDPERLRTLVAALDGVGSAVVTTGRDVDPAALGPVPTHVHVVRFLPQEQVLPLAAASIGHGGSGSTLGALAHGVPLVLIPMGADQFHVATCSASAGAAVVLRHVEADAAAVHRALHTVLEDGAYRQGACAVQAEIAAMPTPAEGAAAVEGYVAAAR